MVPLYTSILTTAEYGTYSLFNTTVGVLLPILTLNVQEGVIRFAMEKDYDREAVVTVGVRHLLIGSAITIIGLVVNSIFGFSPMLKTYAIFFFLMFFVQALGGIVLCYIRGIYRIGYLSLSSVVASAVTIGCNILFLVGFRWGCLDTFLQILLDHLSSASGLQQEHTCSEILI